jgi:5'-3' exoribonuclease 1
VQDGAQVKDFIEEEQDCAIQTTVNSVEREDSRYEEKPAVPLDEEFPIDTKIFFLGDDHYGCPGIVSSNTEENLAVRLVIILYEIHVILMIDFFYPLLSFRLLTKTTKAI